MTLEADFTATSLFCEDIRSEVSGMSSLMGVMGHSVNVMSIPSVLPKLGVFTRIEFPPDFIPYEIEFNLDLPGGNRTPPHFIKRDEIQNLIDQIPSLGELPSPSIYIVGLLGNVLIMSTGIIKTRVRVNETERQSGFLRITGPESGNIAPSSFAAVAKGEPPI